MSRENVEVIRRLYDAWNGDDPSAGVLPFLDPAFEWVNPDYAVEPGIQRGHEGWAAVSENLSSAFEWFEHEPGEFIDRGGKVLCLLTFRARGRDSRVPFERAEQHIWTLRDGKVVCIEWFHDEEEARKAVGMPSCAH